MADTHVVIRLPNGTVVELNGLEQAAELLRRVACEGLCDPRSGPDQGATRWRGHSPEPAPTVDHRRLRAHAMLGALCDAETPRVRSRDLAKAIDLEGPRGLGPVYRVLLRELASVGLGGSDARHVVRAHRDREASWWVRGPRASAALSLLTGRPGAVAEEVLT